MAKNKASLTKAEKERVLSLFETEKNIIDLTRKVFSNDALDGRTKEGKLVSAFLRENRLNYTTSAHEKAKEIELSTSQKEFLMSDDVESGIKPIEVARLVFKNEEITPLSLQHRCIVDFLKRFRPDVLDENDILTKDKWVAPKSILKSIKKINDWVGQTLDDSSMSTRNRQLCEKLLLHLRSPRFYSIINSYMNQADRDLFESEFVRAVWDKPDLSNDELNLYITVCSNYVRQKHIQRRMDKLNALLDDTDEQTDITMRLTDIIKTTSDELNSCEKRIESLTKDLNGSRQARLKAKGEENGSIAALVEAFRDKEERDRMIMMAEMQKKLISDEADRLESMDEYKARVLGISKRELL